MWKLGLINPNYNLNDRCFIGINAEWKGINFYFIIVYSPSNLADKRNLWVDMVNLKSIIKQLLSLEDKY